MEEINFGFIGAGAIAGHAASDIQNHEAGKVLAVQDLSAERVETLREEAGIERGYTEASQLFADPDVDAVYIAVPNKFHAPLAIEALEAGKHVLLEKPFAMNSTEAELVAQTAARTGKTLMLGMNQRFDKHVQVYRELVRRGDFGDVYHAKAYWQRRAGIPKLGTWFGNQALAGAGCLFDIGVHLLDVALYIIDRFEPLAVSGKTYTKFGNRGLGEGGWGKSDRGDITFDVDDFAHAYIRMLDGTTIALDVTWAAHIPQDRFDVELFGTEAGAAVRADQLFEPREDGNGHETVNAPEVEIPFPHGSRFHNFINHLLGKEELAVTVDQALAVQRILDAIQQSSETGEEVKLAAAATNV